MGKLFKRGPTYYGDFQRANGQRVKISLRTNDREVAKARLRAAELGEADNPQDKTAPLAVALDNMLALKKEQTAESYRRKGRHLLRVLGVDCDLNTLTRSQVTDYTTARLREHAARHTIHKELVALRQAIKEARKRGEFTGTLDIVPEWNADYQPITRHLSPREFRKLFAATPPQHRTWLMIQIYTSANLSEMRRITWDHLHRDQGKHGEITIPGTKRTSRYRVVPVHVELREWLDGCDPQKPLVAQWKDVKHALPRLARAAGVPHTTTNDLRRSFGSWIKQAGVDSLHVSHLMGHKSPAMVDRVYGQLSKQSYADAIAKMPRVFEKVRPAGVPVKSSKTLNSALSFKKVSKIHGT